MSTALELSRWERGIRVASRSDAALFAYLWFYEWHLFDAVARGEHTAGSWNWDWDVDESGSVAVMDGDWLRLRADATDDGAALSLTLANTSDHDWPSIAAIIPCLNPGHPERPMERNSLFLDEAHTLTYFLGENGLDSIAGAFPREIHFDHARQADIASWEKEDESGAFVFGGKWPTSERDAYAGIMIRESCDGRYVMGIAWESFLSAQGHNPWNCMHLSVRVGPLARGESRTIRGRLYLMEGSKETCLQAFERDFT